MSNSTPTDDTAIPASPWDLAQVLNGVVTALDGLVESDKATVAVLKQLSDLMIKMDIKLDKILSIVPHCICPDEEAQEKMIEDIRAEKVYYSTWHCPVHGKMELTPY